MSILLDQNPGSLRLVNSSGITFTGRGGRLEINLNGRWGTICDDGFGPSDARLACNQLGYSSYTRYGTIVSLRYYVIFLATTKVLCSYAAS